MLISLLASCSSKEAVLLEEEELVRMSEGSGGAEPLVGTALLEGMEWSEGTAWTEVAEPQDGMELAAGMEPDSQLAGAGNGGSAAAGVKGDAQQSEAAEAVKQVETSTLFVHICGEVMEPGVYELPVGSRIFEAVEAAGGFTETASKGYVNLALELADGWKVEIPALGEEPEKGSETAFQQSTGGITQSMAGTTGSVGSPNKKTDGLVDINTATKQELCTLPGIGESRAESIISYREKNGGFGKIEDIMKVDGIKEGMFSRMKDKICVRGVE